MSFDPRRIVSPIIMTKAELIAALEALVEDSPGEGNHIEADSLLLKYINDPEITKAFDAISKWYA